MQLKAFLLFAGAVVNPTYKEVGTWATWFFAMGYLKVSKVPLLSHLLYAWCRTDVGPQVFESQPALEHEDVQC